MQLLLKNIINKCYILFDLLKNKIILFKDNKIINIYKFSKNVKKY